MVWLPADSDGTEKLAFPLLTLLVLRVTFPSNRETFPVAEVLDNVTPKVTGSPETTGVGEYAIDSNTVPAASVWANAGEVLA